MVAEEASVIVGKIVQSIVALDGMAFLNYPG